MKITHLLAASAILVGLNAAAQSQAPNTSLPERDVVTRKVDKADYKAVKAGLEADYKAAKAKCELLKGREENDCEKAAKLEHEKAEADAKANFKKAELDRKAAK